MTPRLPALLLTLAIATGCSRAEPRDGASPAPRRTAQKPRKARADTTAWVRLAAFSTSFKTEETDRVANIALAVKAVDGAVIAPGDVFSFNRATGPRTRDRGYRLARTLDAAGYRPDLGGGVCLVSSVLHAAALEADLTPVERHPHTRTLPYTRAGLDATVDYGAKDLRLRNTHAFPVALRALVHGDRVVVEVKAPTALGYEVRLVVEGGDVRSDRRVLVIPTEGPGTSGPAQTTFVMRTFRERLRDGVLVSREPLYTDGYPAGGRAP